MNEELTELDIVAVVAGRLQGRSWRNLAILYGSTAQKLRRHVKNELFPTRKKK